MSFLISLDDCPEYSGSNQSRSAGSRTKRPAPAGQHPAAELVITKKLTHCMSFLISRDDWIRTSGLFVPNEARYRAALHPVSRKENSDKHNKKARQSTWCEGGQSRDD